MILLCNLHDQAQRFDRPTVRETDNPVKGSVWARRRAVERSLRLWGLNGCGRNQAAERHDTKLWVQSSRAWSTTFQARGIEQRWKGRRRPPVPRLAAHEGTLLQSQRQPLLLLWSAGRAALSRMAQRLHCVSRLVDCQRLQRGPDDRSHRQRWDLRTVELQMGNHGRADEKSIKAVQASRSWIGWVDSRIGAAA